MQVEVTYVGTNISWASQTNLSIHVSTVHIYLTAVVVNEFHEGADAVFVNTMGRRIGDHEGSEVVLILFSLSLGIFEVDVAVFVASNHHDLHTGHSS